MYKLFALLLLAAAALPAHAQAPSNASIEKLLAVTDSDAISRSIIEQTKGMMRNSLAQSLGKRQMSPAQRKDAERIMGEFTDKVAQLMQEELAGPSMKEATISVYKESLSQKEVDDLIAFYESPTGRIVIEKMPMIAQKTMAAVQSRMAPIMARMGALAQQAAQELKASQATVK